MGLCCLYPDNVRVDKSLLVLVRELCLHSIVRARLKCIDPMSFESLPTRRGSTETLVRGIALATTPLVEMLRMKQEPVDDEEAALQEEMQVCPKSTIP